MDKSDERSLTQTKSQSISTAAATLAGRGLRDLQKIQEWELVFPEDRVVGWIEVMGEIIPAKGIVRIPKDVQIEFRLEEGESNLSFFERLPADAPLTNLDFYRCYQITDDGLHYLSSLHQLQKLDLSYCCEITDSALLHLSTLPRLQELNIGGGNITDTGAAHLSHFLHLKLLDLSCSWEITDAGLDHLSGLPELETLILDECGQFTNEGLISLAMLPKEPLNKSLDKLRTNGNVLIPFVVSLSKHERN